MRISEKKLKIVYMIIDLLTCTDLFLKSGRNLFLQNILKSAVQMINGIVQVEALLDFFIPNSIPATTCVSIKEKIVALCARVQ